MMQPAPAPRELTLDDLLQIEDDALVPELQCPVTGIPLWSQVRVHFIRMAMTDLLYGTTLTGTSNSKVPRSRAVSFMSRALLRNAGMRLSGSSRADICLMTDGIANQWREGRRFNRLTDYFVSCHPQRTLTVEDHFEWRWPLPHGPGRVYFHTPQQALTAIVGRFRVKSAHTEQARGLIDFVSRRARQYCGWVAGPERERKLVDMLASKAAALPFQFASYQRLLERVRPKVLMANVACYGAAAAVVMAAANRAGVTTAEFQHGAISGGHDGYNFAPALRNRAGYRDTLPKHFLIYGSWWGEQVNVPVNRIIIGNPHREETLARGVALAGNKQDVLLLSDGVEFSKYLQLAQRIEPVVARRGLRVVLRPHPLERTQVKDRYGTGVGAVAIDANIDLYASLQTSHAVISELSTGLFEAVGLADKFFMWDTAKARFGYPEHPFQSFAEPDALRELLADERSGQLKVPREAIWAPAWRDRYLAFIGQHA